MKGEYFKIMWNTANSMTSQSLFQEGELEWKRNSQLKNTSGELNNSDEVKTSVNLTCTELMECIS